MEHQHPDLVVGATYRVERKDGWHRARWDGKAFCVVSEDQSGDRWLPEWVGAIMPADPAE